MWNSSIQPIDRTLSGATDLDKSGHGRNGNEGVLCISKAPALMKPQHEIV